MSQSLSNVLIHLIYSTKDREPLLVEQIRDELHRYKAAILKELHSPAVLINSVEDHVHILLALARTESVSHVVEQSKTGTSKWLKTKGNNLSQFYWQSGYAAFSVSQSNVDAVVKYIGNQREHHRRKTFQEEYRDFLARHQIPYDEKYAWD